MNVVINFDIFADSALINSIARHYSEIIRYQVQVSSVYFRVNGNNLSTTTKIVPAILFLRWLSTTSFSVFVDLQLCYISGTMLLCVYSI